MGRRKSAGAVNHLPKNFIALFVDVPNPMREKALLHEEYTLQNAKDVSQRC
jgi:hypothetical protein